MGPLCWLANTPKIVHMLSTCHQPTTEGIGKRNEGVEVMKPTTVKVYNHGMGGVDNVDQQLHNLRTVRKTYKWYKKLAVRLISQATLNSHKVYQRETGNYKMDILKHLHVIALLVTQAPCLENNVPINETYWSSFP